MSPTRTVDLSRRHISTTLTSSNPGSTHSATAHDSYSPVATLKDDNSITILPQHHQQTYEIKIPPRKVFWTRFRGKSRTEIPGVLKSLKAIVLCSWLNVFLIFIPIAWAAHFEINHWKNDPLTIFALCFLSTISLEKLFDFGGEQIALYCGKSLGDLVVVTLNNAVEATLAIILLIRCQLKILQSTIAGVVLLHLLFVPGVAFLTGGARIWQQNLEPRPTQLNQTLLTIGVLALLVPAAFFAALNPGVASSNNAAVATGTNATIAGAGTEPFLSDTLRADLLAMSRGISILLLIVYICSRIFLYDPPGDMNVLTVAADDPEEVRRIEAELAEEDPKVNPWVCLLLLISTVAVMATTAVFLVASVEEVRAESKLTTEWFGIILLPLVSFSGDGTVAVVYFMKTALFLRPETPESLARGRAIDLSIQFTLFWMPFLVLLGWWTDKPLILLFDLYEVAILIGACFLVNYVTADLKTNWAEGVILCAFYVMIALVSWFYKGQIEIDELLQCQSVSEAVQTVINGGTLGQ
ncbi:hypothetical protein JB92DRAFT_3111300 [Gautieria morchelliformis]|nr:hypothetical protein JB92DRAFT_3111300 [Gautieria morchelliformis]